MAAPAATTWALPLDLSNTPDTVSRYPAIASDRQGNVHVVWTEESGTEDGRSAINYTMWDGIRWTSPTDIVADYQLLLPSLAVDEQGLIHLAYIRGGRLMYSQALVSDQPWSAHGWATPVEMDPWDDPTCNARWPEIHTGPHGAVYVLYTHICSDTNEAVCITRSTDSGMHWTGPISISNPGEIASTELANANRLAVSRAGFLYALWGEGKPSLTATETRRVFFARSEDGGSTWTAPRLLSTPADSRLSEALAIVTDGQDRIHVLWRNDQFEVVHRWSDDTGITWSDPAIVPGVEHIQRYGGGSAVLDNQGNIHVLYVRDGIQHVTWSGSAWSAPELVVAPLSQDSSTIWPRMALRLGHELHIVWYDGFPELASSDLEARLQRGEYEVRWSQASLSAPPSAPEPFVSASGPTKTPATSAVMPTASPMPVSPTARPTAPAFQEPIVEIQSVNRSAPQSVIVPVGATVALLGVVLAVARLRKRQRH